MNNASALLCIDIQNDYFPGGPMELAGAEAAARNIRALQGYFRDKGLPILHIAHEMTRKGANFFLPGTSGQQIHSLVSPQEGEKVITKNFPNSFLHTPLLDTLKGLGVTELTITGMMTHMCVDATTRAAADLGFSCTVVSDATATRDLQFAGKTVQAAQVQIAFLAALSTICDRIVDAGELMKAPS
ncbi:MAG: cysteine hydrolase family protein [Desulfocapsaceae bacterium]|nr:cysteine hydrolase family protein [Desulfocapsaceae bacterium]